MRRRDLLRGLFVVAVCSPAIGSAIAKAAALKPRVPKRRPSSAMPMPLDGFPRVQFRKIGSRRYEIILSNPHDSVIFVKCQVMAIVYHGRLQLGLRSLKYESFDSKTLSIRNGALHSWWEVFDHRDAEIEIVVKLVDGTPCINLMQIYASESSLPHADFNVFIPAGWTAGEDEAIARRERRTR